RPQPVGLSRAVRQIKEGDDAQQDRRNPLWYEEPAPTADPEPVVADDPPCYWRPDHERNRNCRHEITGGLRPIRGLKPMTQVDDYTRKERGLCRPQHQAS